jgi:hypothetical protein
MTPPTARPYISYLLRIWCSEDTGAPAWRAYLQDLSTGTQLGFTHLEALCAFLEAARRCVPETDLGHDLKRES